MGKQFKDIYIKLLHFEKLYWYGKSGETVNQGMVNQGKTVVCICIIRAYSKHKPNSLAALA